MNKKMLLIVGILLTVCIGIGGEMYMDKKRLQEDMVKIVKSNEAKEVIEDGLKNLDPKALTPQGVIQSYEVDYDNIERNPMGGIDGTIIVNKNDKMYVYFHLNKTENNKFTKYTIAGNSSMLGEKLREEYSK